MCKSGPESNWLILSCSLKFGGQPQGENLHVAGQSVTQVQSAATSGGNVYSVVDSVTERNNK
jgi:hypothetical protein